MQPQVERVLVINGGSSSIKFAIYRITDQIQKEIDGKIARIGLSEAKWTVKSAKHSVDSEIGRLDYKSAVKYLMDWLDREGEMEGIKAIGHRVVHGMRFTKPETITNEVLEELRRISRFDPEHLPGEIELIEAFSRHYPLIMQIGFFDTAFHSGMPLEAKMMPIPRRYEALGVKRYGFHGLSYEYLLSQLRKVAGEEKALGRVILAHLGNGASMAAVRGGVGVDTTMGFTPTGGMPMSTRTGDMDPSIAWYMMEFEKMGPGRFNDLVNKESGLLGISEISGDMEELLKSDDERAKEAVEYFCYHARKWVGAFVGVLGGLDVLVFSGGIGENAPQIRSKICEGLRFLGVEVDEGLNRQNATLISLPERPVSIYVLKTDEQWVIAEGLKRILAE